MGALVLTVVGLVIAVKGLPLLGAAVGGRRIERAARERDGPRLRRAAADISALPELYVALRRLPNRDLIALGDEMVEAAGEESGARVLTAIAEVVEQREMALARWTGVRERWEACEEGSGGGEG